MHTYAWVMGQGQGYEGYGPGQGYEGYLRIHHLRVRVTRVVGLRRATRVVMQLMQVMRVVL